MPKFELNTTKDEINLFKNQNLLKIPQMNFQ